MPLALQKLIQKKSSALQTLAQSKRVTAQPAAKPATPAVGPGFFGATPPATQPAPKPQKTILPITGIPGGGAIEVPEGIKQPSPMDLVRAGVDLMGRPLSTVANIAKEVTDKKKSSALDVLRA
ncbi:MAG: hypothetical protein ACYCX4_12940, partial [Bacillota bacterium]